MKSMRLLSLLVMAILLFSRPYAAQDSGTSESQDKPPTLERAFESKKPVIALFYTLHACKCTNKRCSDALALTDSIIGKVLTPKFEYVKIETADRKDLAREYKIIALPILVIFDSSGDEVKRLQSWEIDEANIQSAIAAISPKQKNGK